MSRRDRKLKVFKAIGVLRGARSPEIKEPHIYVVGQAARTDVQAALIVINPDSDKPTFKDAVVALPTSAPACINSSDRLYAVALGFVRSKHRKLITRLMKAKLTHYLPEEVTRKNLSVEAIPPHLRLQLSAIRDSAKRLNASDLLVIELDKLLGSPAANDSKIPEWAPFHLAYNTLKSYVTNWRVFHKWREWENGEVGLEARVCDLKQDFVRRRSVDAFKSRLIYLGLPVPKWTPRTVRGRWEGG